VNYNNLYKSDVSEEKMEHYDYLIVGAGFSGAVLAEKLSALGKKVLVIDKRSHIGGNCYDYYDSAGVLVHKYGPHYFRTNFPEVKSYLDNFTEWLPQKFKVMASVNGKLYPLPINRTTLNLFFNINLKSDEEARNFLDSIKEKIEKPGNAEEQVLALAGKDIYEAFFKNYTIKQWGIHPKELDASVTARIPIRTNEEDSYVNDNFQAMPKEGYTKIFEGMLKNIKVMLNTDFTEIKDKIKYDKLIYTGPIDSYFNYKYGKMPYRSTKFEFETHDKEFFQDFVQVNYPNDFDFTRILEIKHVTKQKHPKTTIVKEFPCSDGEPFYPVPNLKNQELYEKYKKEAEKLENIYFIGRLAQYRYLNMDQVIKNALELFEKIKDK